MDIQPLEEIGLTTNEAKTYIQLLKTGPVTAGSLAKKTDIHRSRVYEALERMVNKGIITFLTINKAKHYQAREPKALLELIEEKKDSLSKFIPILEALKKEQEEKQAIQGFQGVGGIKAMLKNIYSSKEYYAIGAPQQSIEIMGTHFWNNLDKKQADLKIETKMIFNEEIRKWTEKIRSINKYTDIRFLDRDMDNLTETIITDDKIMIIVWTQRPLGVLIDDKFTANAYKHYFKILWKEAKR